MSVEQKFVNEENKLKRELETTDEVTEEVWITNRRRVILFMLVLLSALSLPYFRALNDIFSNVHPAFVALLAGLIVTAITFFPAKYADDKYGFSHAVLLGLLTAEFTVYGSPVGFPTPVVLSFFFFMFYVGEQEANELWPKSYNGVL